MSKKVIANQLIDDTKHPFMGSESTSKKNLFVKKKFSAKTVEMDIHQKYGTVLNIPRQNLQENYATTPQIVQKHQIDQAEVSKQKLMSTQEKLSTDELRNIPITNKLTDLLKKTELENKIVIQNMLNVQEKLSLSELENKKLKTELLNLKEIKIIYERMKKYEIENKELKTELFESNKYAQKKLNIQKLEIENKILHKTMLNIQEELTHYKIENDLLKNNSETPTIHSIEKVAVPQSKQITQQQRNTKLTGAKYRIQNDLPYQIGKTMIDCSKTLNGSIKMPFMVYQKIKAVEDNNHNLPPLSEYNDADEVEVVKKHLSYRLGNIVINTIDNPKDILKLPVKIGTEILKFKLKK